MVYYCLWFVCSCTFFSCCFFFFFQAEDGIRDLTVTGVQTCALPISLEERGSEFQLILRQLIDVAVRDPDVRNLRSEVRRSEERRVGKECRSRWSPYH